MPGGSPHLPHHHLRRSVYRNSAFIIKIPENIRLVYPNFQFKKKELLYNLPSSVADPHPTFHFDADPDPDLTFTAMWIRIQILLLTVMRMRIWNLPLTFSQICMPSIDLK